MKLIEIKKRFLNKEITKGEYIDAMYEQHSVLFEYSQFIKKTNISSIEICDDQLITTFRDSGIRFICIPGDKRLAPLDTLNFSEYEKEELEIQYRLIKPDAVIVDIGANLGWYSMHIAKHFPSCRIFAFEPVPRTYVYLNINIRLNQLTNISSYQTGLSDKVGEMELFFDPLLSVNASLQNVSENKNIQNIICNFDTLDAFSIKNSLTRVDFIKCDVEGAEFYSLKGAKHVLVNHKPIVFCEMLRKWTKKFNYHPNDIINYMKDLGYACLVIRGKHLQVIREITDETQDTNFLFLHYLSHNDHFKTMVIK